MVGEGRRGRGRGDNCTRPQAPDNTGRMLSLFVLSLEAEPVYHCAPGREGYVVLANRTSPPSRHSVQLSVI